MSSGIEEYPPTIRSRLVRRLQRSQLKGLPFGTLEVSTASSRSKDTAPSRTVVVIGQSALFDLNVRTGPGNVEALAAQQFGGLDMLGTLILPEPDRLRFVKSVGRLIVSRILAPVGGGL